MAADVGFVLQMMMMGKKGKEEALKQAGGGGVALMTRDLLGGGCCTQLGFKELGLDLKVPFGWEKRMDMASGEVYLQRCTSFVFESHKKVEHDLNLPQLAPFSWRSDDSDSLAPGLDLALNLPTSPARSNLSVCTIEKVRSALERVEQYRKRSGSSSSPASSSSYSAATSEKSGKRKTEEEEEEKQRPVSGGAMFAAGCPRCLLYVLICRRNPKCPRCDAIVPTPFPSSSPSSSSVNKKPRWTSTPPWVCSLKNRKRERNTRT